VRKSERIRFLELQVIELQKDMEVLMSILSSLVENKVNLPDLDAGKWYQKPQE
jgi:hypothetical protein